MKQNVKKRPWFSDQAVNGFLRLNNILFVAALFLNRVQPWLMFIPLVFWVSTLTVLIQRDLAVGKPSGATVFYLILSVLLTGLTLFALVYSIIH